ncbi:MULTISPECIES: 30S ribosomal protein S2 [Rhodomicrobium]|uniref:30S ribosomal protein S2 n=1 Tax=Rhodomicrobium TaxID=1068 RepID=UPI000B4A8EF5|nr:MULTISPECIES: 30S ribosomal protein S2 [Rhodomicrobium]
MALPQFTMRQLLEAGVHFGHQTHRWNPKMERYLFGDRNKIHIIDLAQTVPLLHQALVAVSDIVARGGRVLFVATKRAASDVIADAAKRSAQYYVNHRWLGGMLTNWKTITNSIKRLRQLDEMLSSGTAHGFTKKELLQLTRERDKLEQALGGIRDMGGLPDMMFIIDTNKESIAVAEAKKLGIPVIAVVDSNSNPDGIDFLVPGNDDAGRAITLYCDLIARAAIDGIERGASRGGADLGASAEPLSEDLSGEPRKGRRAPREVVETEPAQLSGFTPLAAAEGEADDLTKLAGVGKGWARKLNEHGIYHFWQIAEFTPDNLEELDESFNAKGKISKSGWIEQAKTLKAEAAAPAEATA